MVGRADDIIYLFKKKKWQRCVEGEDTPSQFQVWREEWHEGNAPLMNKYLCLPESTRTSKLDEATFLYAAENCCL